ncbi:hypothetical protein ACFQ05_21900 [Amycolatopsis umgeniensis]|uniref:Uncharacterized protein n=1 Tax=Amycolatopsis umgeniensis TaxID=336628 RepID=A0A841BE47_9PSEU|nr:hypothetical protein [Amycolatopsis umgeniensis]MBB5858276.1 hypothetical protein [Amycolatopsis umgeniensis]
MDALTAIALLVARYGVQELVGALTGHQESGALAGELFGALAASERRLSDRLTDVESRLAGVEQRLDEVLEQPYQRGLDAGLRKLLTVGVTKDPYLRAAELDGARERFEEAAAAARSPLQTAVAERYVMLCALGLGHHDAARTAWGQLNASLTVAAIDLGEAVRRSYKTARRRLAERGEDRGVKYAGQGDFRGRRYEKRAAAEDQRVRADAADVVAIVGRLLDEAAALGMILGEPRSPRITCRIGRGRSLLVFSPGGAVPAYRWIDEGWYETRWLVEPTVPGPVRFGSLEVNWTRFKTQAQTVTDAPHLQPLPDHDGLTINVKEKITVRADPPIPRTMPITQPGRSRALQVAGKRPFASSEAGYEIPAGSRSAEVSDIVAVASDNRGRLLDPGSIRVGPITFVRYSAT